MSLCAWRGACRNMGYMTPGEFKPLPKKGSADHTMLKMSQAKYMELWGTIDNVPVEHMTCLKVVRNLGDIETFGEFIPAVEARLLILIRRTGFKDFEVV